MFKNRFFFIHSEKHYIICVFISVFLCICWDILYPICLYTKFYIHLEIYYILHTITGIIICKPNDDYFMTNNQYFAIHKCVNFDVRFSHLCLGVTPTTCASSCWLSYFVHPDLPLHTYHRPSHPEKTQIDSLDCWHLHRWTLKLGSVLISSH